MAQEQAPTPAIPPRAVMLERLQERRDEIVQATMRRIFGEIPAYHELDEPRLRADVLQHVEAHFDALTGVLAASGPPSREDLLFTRRHTAARVGRIPIADFLRAFRTFQDVVWHSLMEVVDDAASGAAALTVVGPVLDYVNVATTYSAELYIEIEQLELAGGERVRRDLLEDLVTGRPVAPGPRQDAARDAGLGPGCACVVVVAVPRVAGDDEQTLRSAAWALSRACATTLMPLTVLRRDEIVVVAPAREDSLADIVRGLTDSHKRLLRQRVRLAIGVSTLHPELAGVASAYHEARGAAECLGLEGGVLALPSLSALDYLISFRDPTAQRLIAPAVQRFVQEDMDRGGVLTRTLLAYVDTDLNVKELSRRLNIHANTAHHRLHRIAELTGLDLRKLGDVLQLVVAIRLAQPLGDRPPGAWH